MSQLHGYSAHRLVLARALLHVAGDPDDDLASFTLARGFHTRLLEHYEGAQWTRDTLYRIVCDSVKYYRSTNAVITVEALLAKAKEDTPAVASSEGTTVGQIAGYPRPDKATVVDSLQHLVALRAYNEYLDASSLAATQLADFTGDPTKPLRDLISRLRSTTLWVQGNSDKDEIAYHPLTASLPKLVSEPPYGSDSPPIYIGFPKTDKFSRGFRSGDLIFLTGITNVGKTWVLNHVALHAAKQGHVAVYASAEMEWERNAYRIAGTLTGNDYRVFDTHDASSHVRSYFVREVEQAISDQLPGEFVMIGPNHCGTTDDIREILWDIQRAQRPGLLLVDYLTLVRPSTTYGNATDWSVIGETVRELKHIGLEFGIPIFVVAQNKLDSWKRAPSRENIMYGAGVISQTADGIGELRHLNPDYDKLACENTGVQLPVSRDMKLAWVKMRGCPSMFVDVFSLNFSTGRVKPLDGYDASSRMSVDDMVHGMGLDGGLESV